MNLVLGFGSTETAFEAAEETAFIEFVTEQYKARKLSYLTDELVRDVEQWVADRTAHLRAESKKNDTAVDYPDRYSYYSGNVAASASAIVLIANFMHINRRHGMSPDGWALMQNKRLFDVSSLDFF